MKKAPLTAKARQWLVDALYNKARIAAYEKRCLSEEALAHDVLAHCFGKDWEVKFAAVPEGWLPTSNSISIKNNARVWRLLLGLQPLPHSVSRWNGYEVKDLPIILTARLMAQDVALARDATALDQLHRELTSSLASIRTLEALKEGWPEAYDMLPDEHKAGNRPVPAATLEETLRLYGLLVSDFDPRHDATS
jgi:hypothetical protein